MQGTVFYAAILGPENGSNGTYFSDVFSLAAPRLMSSEHILQDEDLALATASDSLEMPVASDLLDEANKLEALFGPCVRNFEDLLSERLDNAVEEGDPLLRDSNIINGGSFPWSRSFSY